MISCAAQGMMKGKCQHGIAFCNVGSKGWKDLHGLLVDTIRELYPDFPASGYSVTRLPAFWEREINSKLGGLCLRENGQSERFPLT
jgi:hypothetical protein